MQALINFLARFLNSAKDAFNVQVSGSNATDKNGTSLSVSMAKDGDGYGVVRTVDAAPFAYDSVLAAKKVSVVADSGGTAHTAATVSVTINAASSLTIPLAPPAGTEWDLRMLGLLFTAPAGATTGTHSIHIRYGADNAQAALFFVSAAYNVNISLNGGLSSVSGTLTPTNAQHALDTLRNLRISANVPLYIRYENSTDAANSAAKNYRYVVTEHGVN